MANFDLNDDLVVVIVGSGAGGGTLGTELALKGVKTLISGSRRAQRNRGFRQRRMGVLHSTRLERHAHDVGLVAGPQGLPQPARLDRQVGRRLDRALGRRFAALPGARIQDAHALTANIAGANLLDWPITLADMEPYYAKAEDKMGVTRTNNIPGLPGNNNFKVLEAGAKKVGYKEVHTGRMAINSQPRDGRGACQQIGFCFQGCKSGGEMVDALCRNPQGRSDRQPRGPARQPSRSRSNTTRRARSTGVVYADKDGKMQRQKARVVAVAGNSLESPRLLLNSASSMFPDGLANSSGQVGRNYMRHMTASVYAVFDKPVRMWRGTTMAGIVRDEAGNDTKRGFVGGYELETLSLGLPFMAAFLNPGGWGREFTSALDSYENMAGMWIVGEDMPQETNRVTLDPVAKDKFGMPVASVHFDDHANDVAMRDHAWSRGKAIYEAVGATSVFPTPPYPSTHNLGTNRMAANARDGVVNAHGQTHDIKNLFVSDGSQFTTGGAENPTLTIVALAIRQADYIADQMGKNTI